MQQLLSGLIKPQGRGATPRPAASVRRVGVADSALGGPQALSTLAGLFPNMSFEAVTDAWRADLTAGLDILIAPADAARADDVAMKLKLAPARPRVVLILRDADVQTTRRLMREGAADVLPHPVSEPALALSLERLLADVTAEPVRGPAAGQAVALLKAGGGVGATALGVQLAAVLANRGSEVCLADLDVQFGSAGFYLDLPDALTVTDLVGSGSDLNDVPFATALARHASGARLLAAPREMTALETVTIRHAESLAAGLKRDFATTIFDLPSVWTAWTHRLLSLSDRIVLVTQLTVPHIQLAKRQLATLSAQMLDDKPVTLVCNAMSPDQANALSVKLAERALGRSFDVVVPEDRRTMLAAINEGLELSQVKRGTKLEKAVAELADRVGEPVAASVIGGRR